MLRHTDDHITKHKYVININCNINCNLVQQSDEYITKDKYIKIFIAISL